MTSSGYSQGSAAEAGLAQCHNCGGLSYVADLSCETCGRSLHLRYDNAVQLTMALVLTGILLLIPANFLPIMTSSTLGKETTSTILGGVILLWKHGDYVLALIILTASFLVPVTKLGALCWLCYQTTRPSQIDAAQNTLVYRATEIVGRWSMVDVFVVAILVALIQVGSLMSITPGPGAFAFAGAVVATMVAAMKFDSRLLWDDRTGDDNE